MKLFHTATDDDIKQALTTDIYFVRTKQILDAKNLSKRSAVAEFTTGTLPSGWPWGVLCGIEEVVKLVEGLPIDVRAMPEGSIFYSKDIQGFREPVMEIQGPYGKFCLYETPALGFLCQATGVATMAARIRQSVGNRNLLSFGIRRVHPAIAPMVDRSAYIGGFDAVSCVLAAKLIGQEPMGTMPHALILAFGDQVAAWKAYDTIIDKKIPRVALADTFYDEKTEALLAAETLGKSLYGIRLDTPSSRRGDFPSIIKEVRWELNLRGFRDVKIIASGNLDDINVKPLCDAGVDGFGIGTALSDAPSVDFAMDIIEVAGKPIAKRGKLSGRKQVWRCQNCTTDQVTPIQQKPPRCQLCNSETIPMLSHIVKAGKIVGELETPAKIRTRVIEGLRCLSASQKQSA